MSNERSSHWGDAYLAEVATRISPAIGEPLNEIEAVALMDVLLDHTFRFRDRFSINDWSLDGIGGPLSIRNAATVASAFVDDPQMGTAWLMGSYSHLGGSKEHIAAVTDILNRFHTRDGIEVESRLDIEQRICDELRKSEEGDCDF